MQPSDEAEALEEQSAVCERLLSNSLASSSLPAELLQSAPAGNFQAEDGSPDGAVKATLVVLQKTLIKQWSRELAEWVRLHRAALVVRAISGKLLEKDLGKLKDAVGLIGLSIQGFLAVWACVSMKTACSVVTEGSTCSLASAHQIALPLPIPAAFPWCIWHCRIYRLS